MHLLLFFLCFALTNAEDYNMVESMLMEKYDSYGEDWIFIPDGNGQPQVAVLKGEDIGTRSFLIDGSVTFLLFTRYIEYYY